MPAFNPRPGQDPLDYMHERLSIALGRVHMGECPGDPSSDEVKPCSHTALEHATDRVAGILTDFVMSDTQQAIDEADPPLTEDEAAELRAASAIGLLDVLNMRRFIGAAVLSGIAAAAEDPEWGVAVTDSFRKALSAIDFSGEALTYGIDSSAALRQWMNP